MSTEIESQSVLDAKKTELKVDEILAEFLSKEIGNSKAPKNLDTKKKKHNVSIIFFVINRPDYISLISFFYFYLPEA